MLYDIIVPLVVAIFIVAFICFGNSDNVRSTDENNNNNNELATAVKQDKQAKKNRELDNQLRRQQYGGGGHNTGFNISYIDHMIRAIPSNALPAFMSNPLSKHDWTNQVEGAPDSSSRFHNTHTLI